MEVKGPFKRIVTRPILTYQSFQYGSLQPYKCPFGATDKVENNGPDLLGAPSSEQYCCEVYYHCVPITPISQQGCQVVDSESFYCYSTQPLKGYTTQ